MFGIRNSASGVEKRAPAGRDTPIETADRHFISGRKLTSGWPDGFTVVRLGMGCFWGAERLFWQLDGVWVTSVGYCGGVTQNPTYEETCTGTTGHAEVVEVVFDPDILSLKKLLTVFFENHDPTQGMRQGNDVGSQYRSAFYAKNDGDLAIARDASRAYGAILLNAGLGPVTTEIASGCPYYLAETYHQQYLAKNPDGYCGLSGTGITCLPGK